MTNVEATEKSAAVAEQGAHVAPESAPSKKGASRKKGAPKGQKAAKVRKKGAKPVRAKQATLPRPKARARKSWP